MKKGLIPAVRKDITGVKYNYLTAIKPTNTRNYSREYFWIWRCDCGEERMYLPSSVRHESHKSCGCMRYAKQHARALPNDEAAFRQLLARYRNAARYRKYPFEISVDEFREISKQNCHYCGCTPEQCFTLRGRGNRGYVYNGMDRLDNTKGYTKENVVPCCGTCNKMKMEDSVDMFLNKIKNIYFNVFDTPFVSEHS